MKKDTLLIECAAAVVVAGLGVAIAAGGGPVWLSLGLTIMPLAYLVMLLHEEIANLWRWHRGQTARRNLRELPMVDRQRIAVMRAGELLKSNYLQRGWYEDANAAGEAVYRLERDALEVIRAGADVSRVETMMEIGAATTEEHALVFELAGLWSLEMRTADARRRMERSEAA